MYVIVVSNKKRSGLHRVFSYEVDYKTGKIAIGMDVNGTIVKEVADHNTESIIVKKDGKIIDWLWSKEESKRHKEFIQYLTKHDAENGILRDSREIKNMINPYPYHFVSDNGMEVQDA